MTEEKKTDEEARRNCNWCGYELLAEQTNPDLCGACFKQYLECTAGGYEEDED